MASFELLYAIVSQQMQALEDNDLELFQVLLYRRLLAQAEIEARQPTLTVEDIRIGEEILTMDREMERMLREAMAQTQAELRQLAQGRNAIRSYRVKDPLLGSHLFDDDC